MDMIEGKDTILKFWQGALEMGIKSYFYVLGSSSSKSINILLMFPNELDS